MKIYTLALFIIISLTGCSAGKDIKKTEVQQIKKGVTTEQQILSWFGEPVSSTSDFTQKTKTFVYQYDNQDKLGQEAAGFGGGIIGGVLGPIGAIGGNVLGRSTVKAKEETKTLIVVINTNTNIVKDFSYSTTQGRSRGIGTGKGIGTIGG